MTKGRRMGRGHYRVCRLILLLDRIPRYGRVYQYRPLDPDGNPYRFWMYQKRGMWGFYLLDRLNWLDLFTREAEYRHALKESHGTTAT